MYNLDFFPHIKEIDWLNDKTLAKILSQLPKKVLLVHSNWALREGHVDRFLKNSKKSEIISYLLEGEPEYSKIVESFSWIDDYSLIIGIGSGNVMDFCKILSAAFKNHEDFNQSIYGVATKVKQVQKHKKLWLFPSHYSSSSWISKSLVFQRDDYKVSCFGAGLIADKVLIDPMVLESISQEDWLEKSFDCFAHFYEVYQSLKNKDPFYQSTLLGWYQKFYESVDQKDYKNLFFLASFLFSGFIEMDKVEWPIHIKSHAYGPRLKLSHTQSLLIQDKSFEDSSINFRELYGELFRKYSNISERLDQKSIQKLDELALQMNPRSMSYKQN
ncbi:MAG: iron-containing alcohol dehydrogenase [Candidatus Cloacimonetes bacterium]|nr:iron-containing alcohol dehydrogenase [Candidatus Cloacimonadota bacterium]